MFHILSLCILLPRCQWIYIFYSWDWRSCESGISSSRFSYVRFRVPKAHTMSCTCIDLSYFIHIYPILLLHVASPYFIHSSFQNISQQVQQLRTFRMSSEYWCALQRQSVHPPFWWLTLPKRSTKKTIGVHCHLSTVHLRNFCSPLNVYWFETSNSHKHFTQNILELHESSFESSINHPHFGGISLPPARLPIFGQQL